MSENRTCEAAWTLRQGPLDAEDVATKLFAAVGDLVAIEPARYDLNRRGRWRDYDGRRLIVDVLTQRTQLVTIAEDRSVDEGGKLVVLATGKQGELPQAVARWSIDWPPSTKRVEEWEGAVRRAFSDLNLASFILRIADEPGEDPDEGTARMVAESERRRIEELVEAADGAGRPIRASAMEGRAFFPGAGGDPPPKWQQLYESK